MCPEEYSHIRVCCDEEVREPKDYSRQHEDTDDMSDLFSHKSHDQQLSESTVEEGSHEHEQPHPKGFDPEHDDTLWLYLVTSCVPVTP